MAIGCKDATATVQSAADATALASCSSVAGSVLIDTNVGTTIDLSGELTSIGGDLIAENNGALISFSSSSLKSIGGSFTLHNLTLMSTLAFSALTTVDKIDWVSLTSLGSLSFGTTGVTKASSVVIADTYLTSLDGINVASLADMNINNNKRLTEFTTQLGNLSDVLNINANGLNLAVSMPNLQWIANMTISNVTSFSAQSLAAVNGSIRFDSNYFTSFSAPNLTTVMQDISFVSNSKITNITMPLLKQVTGSITIANNTALEKINGFPKLATVVGAVALRGSFNDIELPALNDVRGAFTVTSTGDISSSCSAFDKISPSTNGGNGEILGSYSCTSNNSLANNDTSSTGSSGGSSDTKSAASPLYMSMSTIITLGAFGTLVTAFL
jgi:hypothetical protein